MAGPLKLYDLAFENVVNCYKTGLLQTNVIPIDSILSDQIFEAVMRSRDYCYDDHAKALIKEFKPTKLELNLEYCQQATFSEIRKLKLTDLKIRKFCALSKYIITVFGPSQRGKQLACRPARGHVPSPPRELSDDDDDEPLLPMPEYLFISYFLGDILSEETKRELRKLDISGTDTLGITFGDNWLEAVSLMFPKLEVLNISRREFSSEEFAISCKNLPNLHTLRIGHYQLKNLNGISKLKNLTNLGIDKSKFSKKKDVEELFRLKNLKKFSFSENRHADWNYDFYFAKRFPQLTHLEIKWEKADDEFLKKILPKLPKLQVVVAINTKINGSSAPPSIKVFTSTNATTIMESIAYFRINGDQKRIRDAIMRFWEIYHYVEGRRLSEPEELSVCVDEMEMLFETFKFDQEMSESTIHCLDFIAAKIIEDKQEDNADKILNLLLKILKYHLRIKTPPENDIFKKIFPRIERLIFIARHPNINTICALSMQIILLGKGDFIFEQMCATVLSVFLDDMELSSELFESINFRKLHEYLNKIVKRKDQCRLRMDRTRDVIRYIELFM